ncbi:heavy metal translocating P-type ATPase [Cytobacillus firmus]|uniref:Probable copper-transporting ATPase SynA n=1 Tax=Cytobacillus firmus TaxID=1399 RepID=A0AA46SGU7_CYTFI|nr:cation-translocating P-type ATPase [Cytobacillus firmus]UYG98168.1 cation-translocating P-type ATPase [Cytobacillus firmus]
MSKIQMKVGGMHCSLCTNSINRALSRLDGVVDAQVSIAHQEVLIEYDAGRVLPEKMMRTLNDLGFTPRESDHDTFAEEEQELKKAKRVAWIAGVLVALASILMLITFWQGDSLGNVYGQGFLAILTAVWPASFVLRNAWQSLRRGILNQDVLAGSAAMAGLAGGVIGLFYPVFPAGAFFGATTFVLAFHCIGGYASIMVHVRSSQSVRKLMDLRPDTATRLGGDGKEEEVTVETLHEGDTIRVRPGQRIPVDGKVVQGSSAVDQQLVTGEPLPVDTQQGDEVIGGSLNVNGSLVIKVTHVGEDSFLQKVARQVAEARVMKPGILRLVDRILSIYVPTVFVLAATGGVVWSLGTWMFAGQPDWVRSGFAVLGVLVMGYPCAIGMATPLAIIRASGEAAERGILMRSGEAFQVFRLVDTIVMDKTGTLTEGKPQLTSVWSKEENRNKVLSLAASAEKLSEHPLAHAIVTAASKEQISLKETQSFNALSGRGIEAEIDNQSVLIGTKRLFKERGVKELNLVDPWVKQQQENGQTVVLVGVNQTLIGALALADRAKDDAKRMVAYIQRRGTRVVMATGDHQRVAEAVADHLGISEVKAQLLPEDKRTFVRELQLSGRRVAFVGDGINDAPSLMQADVGIAIGTGTDIAIDAADVVIPGEKLATILQSLELATTSYKMTIRNVFLALAFNGVGIFAAFTGLLHPVWAMLAMGLSLTTVLVHTLFSRIVKVDKIDEEPGIT